MARLSGVGFATGKEYSVLKNLLYRNISILPTNETTSLYDTLK